MKYFILALIISITALSMDSNKSLLVPIERFDSLAGHARYGSTEFSPLINSQTPPQSARSTPSVEDGIPITTYQDDQHCCDECCGISCLGSRCIHIFSGGFFLLEQFRFLSAWLLHRRKKRCPHYRASSGHQD